VRKAILSGQSVDLRRPPFVWRQLPADTEDSLTAQVAACEALHAASGSVVAIRLKLVEQIPDRRIFRRELWREMTRALHVYSSGRGASLRDAAWEPRHRLRRQGRSIEKRTISRTLLIEGLEFEHALILDASEHDAKNFYVAVTRPTKSLTICSRNPVMSF
jgi:hypothetical protein